MHNIGVGHTGSMAGLETMTGVTDSAVQRPIVESRDALTGLPDRRALDGLTVTVESANAGAAAAMAVISFDIDYFKSVNDGYGHASGDAALIEVGQRLSTVLSAAGGRVFRTGGDEFVAILPAAAAAEVARTAIGAVRAQPIGTAPPLWLSASAGVADGSCALQELIAVSDRRLSAAKLLGRGGVVGPGANDDLIPAGVPSRLFERDRPLAAVRSLIDGLEAGGRALVVVDGLPGSGLSRFLEAATQEAQVRGFLPFNIQGADLTALPRQASVVITIDREAEPGSAVSNHLTSSHCRVLVIAAVRHATGLDRTVAWNAQLSLVLQPLSRTAVQAWVRSRGGRADEREISRVLAASGGWPKAIAQLLDGARSGEEALAERRPDGCNEPPAPLDRFWGRRAELERLDTLSRTYRLVTVTGPGGIGKSRLVVEWLRRNRREGMFAHYVALSDVTTSDGVTKAIARCCGVRESAGVSLEEAIIAHLDGRDEVLCLDNFEQVLAAAPFLTKLLGESKGLRLVVTSRLPLRVRGELVLELGALATASKQGNMPDAGPSAELVADVAAAHEASGSLVYEGIDAAWEHWPPAAALFCDRATAAGFAIPAGVAAFPQVMAITERLEGVPLAIELAAATAALGLPEVLRGLDRPLDLLVDGPADMPPRHRSLRATVEWSYRLLSFSQQQLLQRMAVWPGGVPAAAVAALGARSDLGRLVESRLLRSTSAPDGTPRYQPPVAVRDFVLERLHDEGPTAEAAADRIVLDWCVDYARVLAPRLNGHEENHWLDCIGTEHANILAALAWGEQHAPEPALRLAAEVWRYWYVRGFLAEGESWLSRLLAAAPGSDAATVAKACNGAGILRWMLGDLAGAASALTAALTHYRHWGPPRLAAGLMSNLGIVLRRQGRSLDAVTLMQEAVRLCRSLGDDSILARSLLNLGNAHKDCGDQRNAEAAHLESLALRRQLGEPHGLALSLINFGDLHLSAGRHTEAAAAYAEADVLMRPIGDPFALAALSVRAAMLAHQAGEAHRAIERLREAFTLLDQLQAREGLEDAYDAAGLVANAAGRALLAAWFFASAQHLRRQGGSSRDTEFDFVREARRLLHCEVASMSGNVPPARPAAEALRRLYRIEIGLMQYRELSLT